METKKDNSIGGVIGVTIIIILLIIGAWYFFSNRIEKIETQKRNATSTVVNITEFSTSTEITDITDDLNKINPDGLGN